MKRVKIVSFRDVIKSRRFSKYTPSLLIAKELGLKYLIVEENNITGPAVGTTILVDKITKILKIENMLDLCCGTGALTKIAIENGVKKIFVLDKNLKAVKENLKPLQKFIEFIEGDIFRFKTTEFFDLVVLDPPRYLIEKIVERFDFSTINTNLFVMWHGSFSEEGWNSYVRDKLRNFFDKVYSFSVYGEELSVCSGTHTGKKMLERLMKKW